MHVFVCLHGMLPSIKPPTAKPSHRVKSGNVDLQNVRSGIVPFNGEIKDNCILRKVVKFTGQQRRGGMFFSLWV